MSIDIREKINSKEKINRWVERTFSVSLSKYLVFIEGSVINKLFNDIKSCINVDMMVT